jgi:hypothetical protein
MVTQRESTHLCPTTDALTLSIKCRCAKQGSLGFLQNNTKKAPV